MSWNVLGATSIGTGHRARGLPCQDAFRFEVSGDSNDCLLIAVSDGAGSASHSEIGANIACEAAILSAKDAINKHIINPDTIPNIFRDARLAIFREAELRSLPPRELACTMLFSFVTPAQALFAQLGDGAFVIGSNEAYRIVFWPDVVEYANATNFLTDDTFEESIQSMSICDAINEIAVFTDGLQRLSLDYSVKAPFSAFFHPLFNYVRSRTSDGATTDALQAFLDSERVNLRTDDDKTLVVGVRQP